MKNCIVSSMFSSFQRICGCKGPCNRDCKTRRNTKAFLKYLMLPVFAFLSLVRAARSRNCHVRFSPADQHGLSPISVGRGPLKMPRPIRACVLTAVCSLVEGSPWLVHVVIGVVFRVKTSTVQGGILRGISGSGGPRTPR